MLGIGIIPNRIRNAFVRKFGPELVVNQAFDDTTWWTVEGTAAINSGSARIQNPISGFSQIKRSAAISPGTTYRVEFDVVSTNGAILALGDNTQLPTTTTGHKIVTYTHSTGVDIIFKRFSGAVATDVRIDNVSYKEVL